MRKQSGCETAKMNKKARRKGIEAKNNVIRTGHSNERIERRGMVQCERPVREIGEKNEDNRVRRE